MRAANFVSVCKFNSKPARPLNEPLCTACLHCFISLDGMKQPEATLEWNIVMCSGEDGRLSILTNRHHIKLYIMDLYIYLFIVLMGARLESNTLNSNSCGDQWRTRVSLWEIDIEPPGPAIKIWLFDLTMQKTVKLSHLPKILPVHGQAHNKNFLPLRVLYTWSTYNIVYSGVLTK